MCIALALMCLFIQEAAAASAWLTTKFKVDFSTLTRTNSPGQSDLQNIPDPDRKTATDFEPGSPAENDKKDDPGDWGERYLEDDPGDWGGRNLEEDIGDWGERNLEDDLGVWGERNLEDHQTSHNVLALFFESSLHEIAVALEQAGFRPPSLPVYEDGTDIYYKINIFDLSDLSKSKLGGVFVSGKSCHDAGTSPTAWFAMNSSYSLPLTTSREPFIYMILAHELFHSIQESYPETNDALSGCSGNTDDHLVVNEGTANGVAFKLAMKKWPKFYLRFRNLKQYKPVLEEDEKNVWGSEKITVWKYDEGTGYIYPPMVGLRTYNSNFLDLSSSDKGAREQAPYASVSFWYNLIDRYGFRIIDHLYRQPLRYGDSPSLLQWLNNGLNSYNPDIGGLYLAYSHFVTEFASQAGSRFPWNEFGGLGKDAGVGKTILDTSGTIRPGHTSTGSWQEMQKGWVMGILGECQQIKLVAGDKETDKLPIVLDRVSAGCIEITWEGFEDNFELNIEADHSNLRLLDQLNVGLAYQETGDEEIYCYSKIKPTYNDPLWTCLHEKPFQANGPEELRYTRLWSEDRYFSGSGRRIYTISNIAKQAEKTRPLPKDNPVMIHVGIKKADGKDGRQYDPPNTVTKGIPGALTMSPENLYGITTLPAPANTRLSFSVPVKGSDLGYAATWMGEPPPIGYKGPYKGMLSGPASAGRITGSSFCQRHADGVIGQITRFDRDNLWIELDADICEMTIPPPSNGHFPKVDHITASLRFPYGWRYAAGSGPADIVTPGMQVFIDRHAKRLPRVLTGSWQNPGTAITTPGSGTSGPGGPPGLSGSSSTSGDSGSGISECTCSCEELADFERSVEDAKKAGNDEAMRAMAGPMMACMNPCQREYMICRIEADDAEDKKNALLAEQEAAKIDCDCSCEALDKLASRGRELEKRFAAGGSVANEDILQLSHCATACQQQMLSCAMKK